MAARGWGQSQVQRLRVRTENMWKPDAPCQKYPRVGPGTLGGRDRHEWTWAVCALVAVSLVRPTELLCVVKGYPVAERVNDVRGQVAKRPCDRVLH